MGYLHIDNLYKPSAQSILFFRECYALEKVHGTSAHIAWKDDNITFFSGESQETFKSLFNKEELIAKFKELGYPEIKVHGEAYGGKCQRMRHTYGDSLNFIVFDVKIDDIWLSVPDMYDVATKLGLEVVPFRKISTEIEVLNAERDRPSEVAVRRGCGEDKVREGIVLRPLKEMSSSNGSRIIAKHKGDAFRETATPRVVDSSKLEVLEGAKAIANEWVTFERLNHVLQKIDAKDISDTKKVITAMVEDVYREGAGELVESREATTEIGRRTAILFKNYIKDTIVVS